MNDQELTAWVLEFIREVDSLQRKYAPRLLDRRQTPPAVFDAYHREMDALYARFLTSRERHCFYFGLSDPPVFTALEDAPDSVAERKGNRAAITFLSRTGRLDFCFRLRCKGGTWRIDSVQQRVRTARRTYRWKYGSF